MKKYFGILLVLLLMILPVSSIAAFDFSLDLGVDYQDNGDTTMIGLNLQPDIGVGNFGIGLKGSVFFELNPVEGSLLNFNFDNWTPDFSEDEGALDYVKTVTALYLPMIRYVRYGQEYDPLYIRFGELDHATLGTGMFLTGYTNTLYLPDQRIVGGRLNLDGRLFNFPYVGLEALTGNLSEMDLIAGRVYVRPLAFLDFPIISDIQIGGSLALDKSPAYFAELNSETWSTTPEQVLMYGGDLVMPLLSSSFAGLRLFTDYGIQPDPESEESATGFRVGFDGHLLGIVRLNGNLLMPQNGYKPDYFNTSYDLERQVRYEEAGITSTDNYYLNAGAGFNLLEDVVIFDLDLSSEVSSVSGNFEVLDPEMRARLSADLFGFASIDGSWTKTFDGATLTVPQFIENVASLKNSEVRANVSFKYSVFIIDTGYVIPFDANGDMGDPIISVGGKVKII